MLELANIYGHMSCIGLLFILVSGIISRKKNDEDRYFLNLILADTIYLVLGIAWLLVDGRSFPFARELNYIISTLTCIAQGYIGIACCKYLYFVPTGKRLTNIWQYVPAAVLAVLAIASVWTGWLFTVDETATYVRGPLYIVNVILSYGYLVFAEIVCFLKWKTSEDESARKRALIATTFGIAPAFFGLGQILFHDLSLHCYGITLAIGYVFIRLQKHNITDSMNNLEIQRENATRYRNTVFSTALQFMVVNLSKNKILEMTVPRSPKINLEYLVNNKIIASDKYTDIVKYWSRTIVGLTDEQMHFIFSPEIILQRFYDGESRISDAFQVKRKDGSVVWCRQQWIISESVHYNDIVATATIYDITAQKTQENALRMQQEVIGGLAYGVSSYWIVDLDTEEFLDYYVQSDEFRSVAETAVATGSYTKAMFGAYGKLIDKNEMDEAVSCFSIEKIREKLAEQKQYSVPFYIHIPENNSYSQVTFTRIRVNGRRAFIAATRNITDAVENEMALQEKLEEALEQANSANKAKSAFLFNMSHDIRTPMNAILGFNDLIKKNVDNKEKILAAVEKSRISGEHLLSLINDILDMAKIESGKLEVIEEVVDVKRLSSGFEDMFRMTMEKKGINFNVDTRVYTKYIYSDYLRVTRIITNLLSNAMKFTPKGGTISYECVEAPAEEGWSMFSVHVRDTGIGMSEEFQKHLFDMFEREKNSAMKNVQGTGLGLAIAKKLSDLLGGGLTCKSALNEGTDFHFTFKAKIAPDDVMDIETTSKKSTVDLKGKRILVVEDNELNREIAAEILKEAGVIVTEAVDGAAAVELLSKSTPGDFDVVLMDIQMPIMDGYTATQEIRNFENKELASIPIIAMTANAFEEDKRKAVESGLDAHVAKPIDVERLLEVLGQVCR